MQQNDATPAQAIPIRPAKRQDREFLPAALEILETPASPTGRAVAITIIAFAMIAIGWAMFGHIDIITTAQGKVVPSGRTKLIQPYETGVVRAIHVQDGQSVKAGQVLIELDPTINTAERDKAQKDLMAASLDIARLQAALTGATDPNARFTPPEGATDAQITMHRTFLLNQLEEHRAKLANFDRQITQNESNHRAIAATIAKLEATIPILKEREDARRGLSEQHNFARMTYLQDKLELVDKENELDVQKAKLAESEAAIAALKEQRRQAAAEFQRSNFNDLAQAMQKAASLQETFLQAEKRQKLQTLTSPVDGTVQQLAIHTVGGVVTPAQQLMVIVPADSKIIIEAMVPNRDIGFVQPGQPVELKIDTFNFTRYGFITGHVLDVSQDAIVREKPKDPGQADKSKSLGGALSDSSEPEGQELVYAAHIALERTSMQVEDRVVNLTPGMAVTAEIKTGQRRIIEYLLSPLMRYKHESLRER